MGAPEFTENGISIQTYDEVFAELQSELINIYGDINLDSNTPDGQRTGIISKLDFDLQAFALSLYNGLDINLATGEQLNIIGKISGIRPRPAIQSIWDLEVTSSVAFTLPATFKIKDSSGYEWSTEEIKNVVAGSQIITFKSVLFGAIPGTTGTTFEQVTVEPNITDIISVIDAVVGVDEETNGEYRQKLRASTENPSFSTAGKMLAALFNLADVTDVRVYENSTDATDSNNVAAHTLWCVIEGGTISSIAKTIFLNKTGGTGLKGDIVEAVSEDITLGNGQTIILEHEVKFDRPTLVPLFVKVDMTAKAGFTDLDPQLVAEKIAAVTYKIEESASANYLYASAYEAGDNFILTRMRITRTGVVYTYDEVLAAVNEKFTIPIANIDVSKV